MLMKLTPWFELYNFNGNSVAEKTLVWLWPSNWELITAFLRTRLCNRNYFRFDQSLPQLRWRTIRTKHNWFIQFWIPCRFRPHLIEWKIKFFFCKIREFIVSMVFVLVNRIPFIRLNLEIKISCCKFCICIDCTFF